jgi:hypothetical protein
MACRSVLAVEVTTVRGKCAPRPPRLVLLAGCDLKAVSHAIPIVMSINDAFDIGVDTRTSRRPSRIR